MEPPEGNEMQRPPISTREPLISRDVISRMLLLTPLIAVVTFAWYAVRIKSGITLGVVRTETFTLLAVCQWFNVLNCRSSTKSAFDRSIFKNVWLIGGILLGCVLQVLVVFWKPMGDLFHTVPFDLSQLIWIGAAGSIVLWGEELRKYFVRIKSG